MFSVPFARLAILCFSFLAFGIVGWAAEPDEAESFPGDLFELFPELTVDAESTKTYQVEQVVRLSEINKDAKQVRLWVSIPGDETNQTLLTFKVDMAPGKWTIVRDAESRGRFLYTEVTDPQQDVLELQVTFNVLRKPVHVRIDPSKVGEMDDSLRELYKEHLDLNAPHMEVTEEFRKIADEVCGDERNIAVQAELLLAHVAAAVDHYSYSKDPNMPTCGIGDAKICKTQGGGCCTDLNSYFIALARARGIAARLNMGYLLREKNYGKLVDPGYRCWIEYFVPNYGWVSADIVEADTPGGLGRARWFTGLTSRRLWLNQGREFNFGDDLAVPRVNHMSIGYAEIDGVAVRLLPEGTSKPQLTRQVRYIELE